MTVCVKTLVINQSRDQISSAHLQPPQPPMEGGRRTWGKLRMWRLYNL